MHRLIKTYPREDIAAVFQRRFEVEDIENIFIFPNMTDGCISSGAALYVDIIQNGNTGHILSDVYFGPSFHDDQIEQALIKEKISYSYCEDIEIKVAHLLTEGKIVARFNGRMEFGPRALGNRSILCQANDPSVNDWLNKKLGRTEFMSFTPFNMHEEPIVFTPGEAIRAFKMGHLDYLAIGHFLAGLNDKD